MKSRNAAKPDRRDVLRALGIGAGAATAAAGVLTRPAKADSETNDERRKARYKETDHVRAFYRVNKYPS
jgi:hypothetical protein